MEQVELTATEACRAAGVSKRVLYDAIANGDLVARKRGRKTLLLSEDLELWAATMSAAQTSGSTKNPADPGGMPRLDWIPIGVLRPNPRNARTHSKKQLRQIAASIRSVGFLNPIIVDDANVVLAGHGRLEAARLEGLSHVPVVRFGHLTPAQKRAYVIADNKIAQEAGWDRELLAIELGELIDLLPAEGFEISLTGFEAPEIDQLMADMASPRDEPLDGLPALPENPTTRRGDLWQLGKHRLICGDAREAADLARLMQGASASAVFCDPPYNRRANDIGGRGRVRHPQEGAPKAAGRSGRSYRKSFSKRSPSQKKARRAGSPFLRSCSVGSPMTL